MIVLACRLDAPNQKYFHCLTYDQIYSKFYRLFNRVVRCCRFWNLFGFVSVYDRKLIRYLLRASDDFWNEYARRQLHDYYEFLENCNDKQRTFLFSRTVGNEVFNSTEKTNRSYSYDYSLSDLFLKELTAANWDAVRDKVKHKEYNDLSGVLCLT